jgi:glycosyltransferase involved in cell wall biosynthesis
MRSQQPTVSVVVVSHNEGVSIRKTVDNLVSTTPPDAEIIVVDDASTDGSCRGIDCVAGVRLCRPSRRLGAAAARNFGARNARGRMMVFCDAHVLTPSGWFPPFDRLLRRPDVGVVGPAYCEMQARDAKGYGPVLSDAGLNWIWLEQQSNVPYPVPMLGGYFIGLRRSTFWQIGGFDVGFGLWGMEDLEFSLRVWLLGFKCMLVPTIEVAHLSRVPKSVPDYQRDWQMGLRNVLRVAVLHLGEASMQKVFNHYARDPTFSKALAALAVSDAWHRRDNYLSLRARSDSWFFKRFGIRWDDPVAPQRHGRPTAAQLINRPLRQHAYENILVDLDAPVSLPAQRI